MPRLSSSLCIALLLAACARQERPAPEPAPPAEPALQPEPAAPEPAAEPEPTAEPEPAVELQDPADPNEACGQIVVVAYEGAKYAAEEITRSKDEAAARAAELLGRLKTEDFATLAKAESDAPSSAPRGGVMGTYTKDEWPEIHAAMEDTLFGLKVHEIAAQPVDAEYGRVIVRRCPVEKAASRHILIRYAGAERAEGKIKRSREEAKKLAGEVHGMLTDGKDFAELAKQYSEDGSAKRGGEVGYRGRGLLAPEYEDALFALKDGELSSVVETGFGFHIIQRLPDPK